MIGRLSGDGPVMIAFVNRFARVDTDPEKKKLTEQKKYNT